MNPAFSLLSFVRHQHACLDRYTQVAAFHLMYMCVNMPCLSAAATAATSPPSPGEALARHAHRGAGDFELRLAQGHQVHVERTSPGRAWRVAAEARGRLCARPNALSAGRQPAVRQLHSLTRGILQRRVAPSCHSGSECVYVVRQR